MAAVRVGKGFGAEESGAVLVFIVILLPLMLLIGGIATDISMLNAQKRYTQGQADLAAQSASRFLPDPVAVRAEVRRVVSANLHYGDLVLADSDIVMGTWTGPGTFASIPNQTTPAGATAVRVTVPSPFQPFLWGSILHRGDVVVRKSAVGRNQALAVFTLRNRLLSLDTSKSILNGILGPLGLGLNVHVLDYEKLAGTKVNLNDLLGLATAGVDMRTMTFGDVLDMPIRIDQLLGGLVTTRALPTGSVLPVPGGLGQLRFRDLLTTSPGFLTAKAGDVLPDISVDAFSLVTAFAALASRSGQRLGLVTGINLAPLADVKVDLGLIRPPVTVVARPDEVPPVVAHLDQVSLTVEAKALGLLSLGVTVEVAEANANLTSLSCSGPGARAVFRVQTFPAGADIRVGLADAGSYSTPRSMSRIPIAGSTTNVAIPIADIGKVVPVPNRITLSGAVTDLNNVLKQLKTDLDKEKQRICSGILGCVVSLLGSVLAAALNVVNSLLTSLSQIIGAFPVLDNLLETLFSMLGIDEAQAELILHSASCGGGLVE